MEKLTSYNYRKIINTALVLLLIGAIIGASFVRNTTSEMYLWEMMFSPNLTGNLKTGSLICGALLILSMFIALCMIPHILRKKDIKYFKAEAFITIFLIFTLLINVFTKCFEMFGIVLIIIALIINLCSTIFAIFIVKYNYDEVYSDTILAKEEAEEAKEAEENKEDDGKVILEGEEDNSEENDNEGK